MVLSRKTLCIEKFYKYYNDHDAIYLATPVVHYFCAK